MMRLTGTLVLLTVLFVMGFAATSEAQRVTVDRTAAELRTVLADIRKQTGFAVVAPDRLLRRAAPVTLHVSDVSLQSVLPRLAEQVGYLITIPEGSKAIVVSENKAAAPRRAGLPDAQVEVPLQMTINGKVTDSLGLPLQGVTVQVVGTNRQTSTNANGFYELAGVPQDASLLFRLLSYETFEVTANRPVINVVLKHLVSVLDETEVRGYYNVSRRMSTGSVSTVSAKELERQPVGNPIAALQGIVPGLTIRQRSGTPGREFLVELRGRNSIANGVSPLYIVDGVPFPSTTLSSHNFGSELGYQSPFNNLNLTDIESITVLKDADATAIYGSMGANGVILITTKKGEAGRTKVEANYYTGFGNIANRLEMLNTQQYIEMRTEALRNDGFTEPRVFDHDVNGNWDMTRYTDWQDVFIGGTSNVNDAQLRISGGNQQTQFLLGGGYRKEGTVFPGSFFDEKLSLQSNFNHTSTNKKFGVNFSFGYSNNDNVMPTVDLTSNIALAPNAPALYDAQGNLNWENGTWDNPMSVLHRENRSNTDNFLGSGVIRYELLPGLSLKGNFGFNIMEMRQTVKVPSISWPPARQNLSTARSIRFMDNNIRSWILEPQIEYKKELLGGTFESMIGAAFRENIQNTLTQTAANFPSDALIENIRSATVLWIDYSGDTHYRYNALYGRIGYTRDDKYILNLTGRRDGSSRFGQGNRFGNFGAISAAWVFSNEKFVQRFNSIINHGKIRASYGITGNDQLTDYQYLSTYTSLNYTYLGNSGLFPSRHSNSNFSWETVKKSEIAIDLGLLQGRIFLSASWYRNQTGNQLVGYALPEMTGFGTVQANLPAVIENRGVEVDATFKLWEKQRFRWAMSGNISFPRNTLVSYPNLKSSAYAQTYEEGKSMFISSLFTYTGVDPQTGLFTFDDKDNDGNISYASDRSFFVTEPKFHGGINNDITYKSWNLSFLFQFSKRIAQDFLFYTAPGLFNFNQPITVLDRWRQVGDTGKSVQRPSTGYLSSTDLFNLSNGNFTDASFIRLKNVSLSWSVPNTYLQKVKIQSLRFYTQGQNLWTWTKYQGLDPESAAGLVLPPVRMISFGVQITL